MNVDGDDAMLTFGSELKHTEPLRHGIGRDEDRNVTEFETCEHERVRKRQSARFSNFCGTPRCSVTAHRQPTELAYVRRRH